MPFGDPFHFLFVALPILVVTLLVQAWVRSVYARWSRVGNSRGLTGAEAAHWILERAGVSDVPIEETEGWLSDHYDPARRVLRLSPQNFRGRSIAAVAIAAHEAGHAIQHARAWAPLAIRNLAVPMASFGSRFGYIVLIIGLIMGAGTVNWIAIAGLLLIAAIAVFQLVNLPVEFDASRRAMQMLPAIGITDPEEVAASRSLLTAAAMTYVAATAAALWELVYWAWRLGLLGGRRRE